MLDIHVYVCFSKCSQGGIFSFFYMHAITIIHDSMTKKIPLVLYIFLVHEKIVIFQVQNNTLNDCECLFVIFQYWHWHEQFIFN